VLYETKALYRALRETGERDAELAALVFEVFGDTSQAFDVRGWTAEERRWSIFVRTFLLRYVGGEDMYSIKEGVHGNIGGIPIQAAGGMLANAAAVEQLRMARIHAHVRTHTSNPVEVVHSIVHQVFGRVAVLHRVLRGWWKVAFVEKQRRNPARGFGMRRGGKFMYVQRILEFLGGEWDGSGVPPMIAEFDKPDEKQTAKRCKDNTARLKQASAPADSARQWQKTSLIKVEGGDMIDLKQ